MRQRITACFASSSRKSNDELFSIIQKFLVENGYWLDATDKNLRIIERLSGFDRGIIRIRELYQLGDRSIYRELRKHNTRIELWKGGRELEGAVVISGELDFTTVPRINDSYDPSLTKKLSSSYGTQNVPTGTPWDSEEGGIIKDDDPFYSRYSKNKNDDPFYLF